MSAPSQISAAETEKRATLSKSDLLRALRSLGDGDFSAHLPEGLTGVDAEIASAFNALAQRTQTVTGEFHRVAHEVGTEGKLGVRATVQTTQGTWGEAITDLNHLLGALTSPLRAILDVSRSVACGNLNRAIQIDAGGEFAALKDALNEMIRTLRDTTIKNIEQDWLKTNLAKFTRMLQGQGDRDAVVKTVFQELAPLVSVQYALFYSLECASEGLELQLRVQHSDELGAAKFAGRFRVGEGSVGRCAELKRKLLIARTIESTDPGALLHAILLPVMFEGRVLAVIELASADDFDDADQALLGELSESLGIVLHSIEADQRTQALLKQSQALASELQLQQQQLRQSNEELEDKARLLAVEKDEVEKKNREIEQARQALREKADQVAQTSKYKSEFLANMSHELRTPLNSMLLLARQLAENHERTMTDKQVEFAKIIHAAGNELLRLINDILDLSKIESGTVTVDVGELQFWEIQEFVERNFRVLAKSKNLDFSVQLGSSLPPATLTDGRRLEQILKNLLSNAFKFTEKGGVHLRIKPATSGWSSDNVSLSRAQSVVAFSVADTGIGIAEGKQKIIFEAFQQGDGGTNRRFGGTGLGLTISREIAHLLGGEIELTSKPGAGSVFTLYLPLRYPGGRNSTLKETVAPVEVLMREEQARLDDRDKIEQGDKVLLSVEGNSDFAGCLRDIARKNGFRALGAVRGEEALELIQRFRPQAVTLDVSLPDMDGWKILETIKNSPETRHIPVIVISSEADRARGFQSGTVFQLLKPVPVPVLKDTMALLKAFAENKCHRLLVVKSTGANFVNALGPRINATFAKGGQAALALCKSQTFDCIVTETELSDMSGLHFLGELKKTRCREIPIVLHAGNPLSARDRTHLRKLENKLLLRTVYTPERLLDQTALFLHLPIDQLSPGTKRAIESLYNGNSVLSAKRALIVDDDIRNVFALTSLIERHGMQALSAENGQAAIDLLKKGESVDVVLMDIMMPGLDGYETIKILRSNKKFEDLPIIAVTAKAMKEDRLKCLQTGASDYISKPVDSAQLLATLRAWLRR